MIPTVLPDYARGHLSDGLRNSTDCPVRRVLESIPQYRDRYHEFPEGVGALGHIIADHFVNRVLTGRETWGQVLRHAVAVMLGNETPILETEYEIEWAHGITHLDAVVYEGPYKGVWEIKTFNDAWRNGKAPSGRPLPENVRQVQRQMYLASEGGYELPEPWRIVKIGKSRGWIPSPTEIELTPEARDAIEAEFDAVTQVLRYADRKGVDALDDAAVFAAAGLECRCSACWPKPRVEAKPSMVDKMRGYRWLDAEYKQVELDRKQAAEAKKKIAETRDKLRDQLREAASAGEVITDGETEVSLSKSGALLVRDVRGKHE